MAGLRVMVGPSLTLAIVIQCGENRALQDAVRRTHSIRGDGAALGASEAVAGADMTYGAFPLGCGCGAAGASATGWGADCSDCWTWQRRKSCRRSSSRWA